MTDIETARAIAERLERDAVVEIVRHEPHFHVEIATRILSEELHTFRTNIAAAASQETPK